MGFLSSIFRGARQGAKTLRPGPLGKSGKTDYENMLYLTAGALAGASVMSLYKKPSQTAEVEELEKDPEFNAETDFALTETHRPAIERLSGPKAAQEAEMAKEKEKEKIELEADKTLFKMISEGSGETEALRRNAIIQEIQESQKGEGTSGSPAIESVAKILKERLPAEIPEEPEGEEARPTKREKLEDELLQTMYRWHDLIAKYNELVGKWDYNEEIAQLDYEIGKLDEEIAKRLDELKKFDRKKEEDFEELILSNESIIPEDD